MCGNKIYFIFYIFLLSLINCSKEASQIAETNSDIYDISNGERLSTYAIPGKPDTGIIAVNGAACHKINVNDQIIICTYCMLKDNEYVNHKPTIIYVDEFNNIIDKPVNKKINAV